MKNGESLNVRNLAGPVRKGYSTINIDGINIKIRYKPGHDKNLLILFHGASNRETRELPKFASFVPNIENCHQISIADPTLELGNDLASAWYLGAQDLPLQEKLPIAIQKIAMHIGAERTIYVGGSSGGFAALSCSWYNSDSICITVNPQINLKIYIPKVLDNYLRHAWPKLKSIDDLDDKLHINLGHLYTEGFNNTVIYLQSVGDKKHFSQHFSEFISAGCANSDRFILDAGYWGIPGHSNSVPSSSYYPWIRAALASPSTAKQDILDTYHTMQAGRTIANSQPTRELPQFVASDLEMASVLSRYQMRGIKGKLT